MWLILYFGWALTYYLGSAEVFSSRTQVVISLCLCAVDTCDVIDYGFGLTNRRPRAHLTTWVALTINGAHLPPKVILGFTSFNMLFGLTHEYPKATILGHELKLQQA